MDGKRIQIYWGKEIEALIETYQQFERLIPNEETEGAAHRGEDGRFVEELLRQYLQRYLPSSIEVLTGFILRPAVKTGLRGKERSSEKDTHSTQLDILVYDSSNYPLFQRFGNSAIVPPEGVLAIISVKKNLSDIDIKGESDALMKASKLCFTKGTKGKYLRGPFLAIVSMNSKIIKKKSTRQDWIFKQLEELYNKKPKPHFEQLVGYIGALNEWSVFKTRPQKSNPEFAKYIYLEHKKKEEHLGLQYILTGILSVFYDVTRRNLKRPGYTAFPSKRPIDKALGEIAVRGGETKDAQ